MLIVVAGLKRSGTTWVYNVARVALTHADVEHTAGGDELYHTWDRESVLLVKTHWWHEGLATSADVILSSDRDVEHAHASLEHLLGREVTGRELAKVVEHHRRWDAAATWRMTYDDLAERPAATAKGLVAALGLDVDPDAVLREVESLRLPATGQDPVTMLFHNHRRGDG